MELTRDEIITNAIADLEFAIEFVQFYGDTNKEYLTEHEAKIDDMRNSVDKLYELLTKEKLVQDMIEWLGEHDQANEDFMKKYGYNLNEEDEYIKKDRKEE